MAQKSLGLKEVKEVQKKKKKKKKRFRTSNSSSIRFSSVGEPLCLSVFSVLCNSGRVISVSPNWLCSSSAWWIRMYWACVMANTTVSLISPWQAFYISASCLRLFPGAPPLWLVHLSVLGLPLWPVSFLKMLFTQIYFNFMSKIRKRSAKTHILQPAEAFQPVGGATERWGTSARLQHSRSWT